jgi:hypothetical protein
MSYYCDLLEVSDLSQGPPAWRMIHLDLDRTQLAQACPYGAGVPRDTDVWRSIFFLTEIARSCKGPRCRSVTIVLQIRDVTVLATEVSVTRVVLTNGLWPLTERNVLAIPKSERPAWGCVRPPTINQLRKDKDNLCWCGRYLWRRLTPFENILQYEALKE